MSGDVQPRKRKDKKKKKDSSSDRARAEAELIARKLSLADESDEGASVPGKTLSHSASLGEGDAFIHVHHEGGTGGHWCAKIVFFSLLGVLIFLIGLILVENRGLTDLDIPATESRYAQIFDGWIDEGPLHDDHHDEHTLELKHEDEGSHEDEHDDLNEEDIESLEDEHGHTDYEQSDGEDEQSQEDNEQGDNDDNTAEEDDNDDNTAEENEEDDANDDDDNDDNDEDDDEEPMYEIDYNGDKEDDDDYLEASKENDGDQDDDNSAQNDDGDDENDDYLGASNEDEADQNDDNSQQEDDDDFEKPLEEVDSNEEDVVDNSAREQELLEAKKAEQLAQEKEESKVGMRVGIGLALVIVAYCVLARKFSNASESDDGEDVSGDLNRRMTLIDNDQEEESEEEVIEQPPPVQRAPIIKTPPPIVQTESLAKPIVKTPAPLTPEAARIRQVIHRYIEDDDEDETPKAPVVAEPIQEKVIKPVLESKPKEPVKPVPTTKELSQEEQSEEEEDVEEITKEEIQNIKAEYEGEEDEEELGEDEEEIDEEIIEEEEIEEEEEEEEISDDEDDSDLLKKLEEKYGKLPQQDDDQAEGQSDEDQPPVMPARKKGKPSGGNSAPEEGEQEDWVDDTSSDHWKEQLELAQAEMDEGRLEKAYRDFTALSLINQSCPLAKYGRAKALESMAEAQRSNNLLDKAIEVFKELLNMKKINEKLFLDVAKRAIAKMRFRGKYIDAVPVHYMLIMKFPDVIKYRNDLAITYLMVNKVNMARKVLNETLSIWPDDGVALVHYGFILKTEDNDLSNGAKFMQKGIDIGGNDTLDGRFLFHLGDAYARLGNLEKANEIYALGASVGVFLSPVQRSLYNVNRLTGRPWWKPEQTPYTQLFKELEENWKAISKEAKNLHSAYEPEQENLKDKGDWSQFQMFVRGREVNNNCKKCPVTCSIVKKELSAWNCRRGQIKFSAMQPGTHVFAHTGPTNCRIRAHLGLLGTEGTFIRVANETRSWETGKILIFDDSFDHEVWHNGTQLRIVLIVDLWHPELTKEERLTLPAI